MLYRKVKRREIKSKEIWIVKQKQVKMTNTRIISVVNLLTSIKSTFAWMFGTRTKSLIL